MSQVNGEINIMVISKAQIHCNFTHRSSTPLWWCLRGFFPNGWKRPLLQIPFHAFHRKRKASVKQSLVKCSEHTANFPTGLKSFWWMDTNLFHFNLTLPKSGELWIEIPNSSFFTFPRSTRHTFALSQKKRRKNLQKFPKVSRPACEINHVCLPCFSALMFLRHISPQLLQILLPVIFWIE